MVFEDVTVITSEDQTENFKNLFTGLHKSVEQWSRRGQILYMMQSHLFALILAEKLVAVGVQTKPALGSGPEIIPAYLFDKPKANYRSGTIENFGRRFEAVKVHALGADAAKKVEKPPAPKSTGRPSKHTEISRAIDALAEEGVDVSTLPRKDAYSRIRTKAKTQGANVEIGFSDPVIQRVVLRRYGPRE